MTTQTQQRVALVLSRLTAMAAAGDGDAKMIATGLDQMLDDIAASDGFGTEQQCDPRGDFRNGVWSMEHVEGLDA